MVRFDWLKICSNNSTQCIVEDSFAVYTNNAVRPCDVKQLCDGCRRVIFRGVDVVKMGPRERLGTYFRRPDDCFKSDKGFKHGKSPKAIRKTIRFVRESLWNIWDGEEYVVFMSKVR